MRPGLPAGFWSVVTAGELVAYPDGDTLTVLSADGEVVRTDLPGARGWTLSTDLRTGLPVLPAASSDVAETTETTTLLAGDADPDRDRVLLGRLVDVTVDDGSLPGLVLTSREKLYAWDEETGRPRWERDLEAGFDALVVRGRVYLCSSTSVVALDGRTGDLVWEAEAPSCSYSGLATDGRDLLVRSITTGTAGLGGMTGYDFGTSTGDQTVRAARGDRRARDVPGPAPGLLADVRGGRRPAVIRAVQSRHGAPERHAGGRAARR